MTIDPQTLANLATEAASELSTEDTARLKGAFKEAMRQVKSFEKSQADAQKEADKKVKLYQDKIDELNGKISRAKSGEVEALSSFFVQY